MPGPHQLRLRQPTEGLKQRKVVLKQTLGIWPHNFDNDLATVGECGAVALADGGCADGLWIEGREDIGQRSVPKLLQLARDDPDGKERVLFSRDLVLQKVQQPCKLLRDKILARSSYLPELEEETAHID